MFHMSFTQGMGEPESEFTLCAQKNCKAGMHYDTDMEEVIRQKEKML